MATFSSNANRNKAILFLSFILVLGYFLGQGGCSPAANAKGGRERESQLLAAVKANGEKLDGLDGRLNSVASEAAEDREAIRGELNGLADRVSDLERDQLKIDSASLPASLTETGALRLLARGQRARNAVVDRELDRAQAEREQLREHDRKVNAGLGALGVILERDARDRARLREIEIPVFRGPEIEFVEPRPALPPGRDYIDSGRGVVGEVTLRGKVWKIAYPRPGSERCPKICPHALEDLFVKNGRVKCAECSRWLSPPH